MTRSTSSPPWEARGLGARRAVARVQGNEWSGATEDELPAGVQYGLLGVDVVFNPRVLLAQEVAKIAQSHGALEVLDLANDRIEVVQVEIGEHGRLLNKPLSKLQLPKGVLVGAVVRDKQLFVPGGADVLLPDDRVYLIGQPEEMLAAEDLFSRRQETDGVCIVGGGVIGESLARLLVATDLEVMMIELNHARAQRLAARLPSVTVVQGDGPTSRCCRKRRSATTACSLRSPTRMRSTSWPASSPAALGWSAPCRSSTVQTTARFTVSSASTSCCRPDRGQRACAPLLPPT